MDPELQRAKSIFERAIELDTEARAGYVEGACADGAALKDRVERLLGEHDKQGDFLASRGADQAAGRSRSLPPVVSHYRVLEKLGAGAMGEVWKAEDLDLKRVVALKFISREMLGDAEVKARMIREAQAAASLDHPNITTVHGIHEDQGETFLAMAYIDGPSLAEKIKERPLPLDEALDIAIQIAEGLQEAHEQSVVHRDIKPSNVMLDRRGCVKIMDFGLAAVADRTRLTKSGMTLGTPAYMSPEQAQGQAVDHRTDIWALGVVLYEMLAGKHPFRGEYEQAIVYGIINENPEPLTALRSGLPTELDRLLAKLLAKNPEERYQNAGDVVVDLRGANRPPNSSRPAKSEVSSSSGKVGKYGPIITHAKLRMYQLLFAVSLAAMVGLAALHLWESPDASPLRRFGLFPPVEVASYPYSANSVISPDGRHVAFVEDGADGRLWVQDLDQDRPRPIDRTAGALMPFWSPDSELIGFVAGGQMKKVSIRGGAPVRICEMSGSLYGGASWSPDGGIIVFSERVPGVLFRVSAGGGEPEVLIDLPELGNLMGQPVGYAGRPHFLPLEAGPRTVLFTASEPNWAQSQNLLVAFDLRTRTLSVVGLGDFPWYSPSGHIVYQAGFSAYDIWAVPIDLRSLEPTGDSFLVAEGGRGPSVAADGTLAYATESSFAQERLVWVNRKGLTVEPAGLEHERIRNPELSPDGRLVGVLLKEETGWGNYVYDTVRKNRTRLASNSRFGGLVWSGSGEQVSYRRLNSGAYETVLRWIGGEAKEQILEAADLLGRIHDWSADGERLVYVTADRDTQWDIWYLQRGKDAADWTRQAF